MPDSLRISPAMIIDLIDKIQSELLQRFESYNKIRAYIKRWQSTESTDGWHEYHNFHIYDQDNKDKDIDLYETLTNIESDELILKIAIDLGIEVPGLIYGIAEIKGMLSARYDDAYAVFENAVNKIYSEPSTAISMAYSALEKIIKRICEDPKIENCDPKHALEKSMRHILKVFNYYPDENMNENIRNIGSGLLTVTQAIGNLRSNHTPAHGGLSPDIDDPIYAMLVVNAVSTIGLFLLNFYEKKYAPPQQPTPPPLDLDDEIPF